LDQLVRFNHGELDPRFADRLDLDHIGVFGHSTGGGAAVEVCYRDARCKAGLGMDAWVVPVSDAAIDAGLSQPFLFMHSAAWSTPQNAERFDRLYDRLKGHAYQMTIAGTRHFDFTDVPLFSPLASMMGLKGPLDGARVVQIINDYSLAFFDRYLKEDNTARLNATPQDYPEVIFESR
jgi:predicted dienelactone hydrolase